jgi:hypothetical protein
MLKVIKSKIGFTPDISENAAKNLQRGKYLFATIDSIIESYPNYKTAREHLTSRQIKIYENEEEYSKEDHLDVGTWGCSWYCGGGPDSIFASSELKSFKNFDYKANNAHDFSLRTAWIEGHSGYGVGESLTYRFAKHSPPVTTIEIYNGYMKSEKTWQNNSRVKRLKLHVDGKPYAFLELKDIKSKQIFEIGLHQGQKTELYLKFEIVDVYKGDKYDDVAISEIEFDGTGVHCFAKGTLISIPDNEKPIEQLEVGDKVLTFNTLTFQIETAKVLELSTQKHHNLYELDFNITKIKVTDDHPFYSKGEFYSVVQNNNYGVMTKTLSIGQKIEFLIDGEHKLIEFIGMKKLYSCEETFTITKLDKNKIFYANGACVTTEGMYLK